MRTCGIVEILCRILPFRAWRGNLLERHALRCPACRSRLAPREEAALYVAAQNGAAGPDTIWPAVEARIRTRPETPGRRRHPYWPRGLWRPITEISALAVAGLLIF